MTRPQHVEAQADAPHPDARWNPAAYANEGRWELPDGTPVAVLSEVAKALSWLEQGGLPHRGHVACLADRVGQLEAELAASKRREAGLYVDLTEELALRDAYHEIADQLAYAIAPMEVIGEHSSHNCPWTNALEIAQSEGNRQ